MGQGLSVLALNDRFVTFEFRVLAHVKKIKINRRLCRLETLVRPVERDLRSCQLRVLRGQRRIVQNRLQSEAQILNHFLGPIRTARDVLLTGIALQIRYSHTCGQAKQYQSGCSLGSAGLQARVKSRTIPGLSR